MSSRKKGILKILNEIRNKTISHDELIESIQQLGKIGNKSMAEDLIPLLDEFDDEEVIFQIRETLSTLGITANFMNEEGNKKDDEEDYDCAIRKYELAIKLDPNFRWAWYNMARMYGNQKKDSEKAIELYKRAISIKENYGEAWNSLGNVYYDLEKFSFARKAYERSIQCEGYINKHYPYYNLGLIYNKLNNQEKALKYFLKSVEFKKDYPKALFNAGKMYQRLGEHEKASIYFARTLESDQSYDKDIRELGVIVEEVMAMQILRKLDKIKPEKLTDNIKT